MTKTNEPNYCTNNPNYHTVLDIKENSSIQTSFNPVNCVEMKATIDLYHIYAEKFNDATIKDEANWCADICAVLLNRIREMEKRLHNELEVKCSE